VSLGTEQLLGRVSMLVQMVEEEVKAGCTPPVARPHVPTPHVEIAADQQRAAMPEDARGVLRDLAKRCSVPKPSAEVR
jgi:hypothetical protein